MYALWRNVPEDQFAAASDSDEVRRAHFGPEWARFSTVGKMSVQQASQNSCQSVRSDEERHSKNVAIKREQLEKHNFSTYEEFLASQDLSSFDSEEKSMEEVSRRSSTIDEGMEESGSSEAYRSNDEEGPLPLPNFMKSASSDQLRSDSSSEASSTLSTKTSSDNIPKKIKESVYSCIPSHLSHASISLEDPLRWNTNDIIYFLARLTPVGEHESSVMDDTMISTFEMANVTGSMLLHRVTPPNLFRIMRQWHVARHRILLKSLKMDAAPKKASEQKNDDSIEMPSAEAIQTAVREGIPSLEAALGRLTPQVIQETILLCFPYGYGKFDD